MSHNPVESTTLFDVSDAYFQLLKGYSLREWLTDQRDLGHTYRTIASRLEDVTEGAITVTYRTIGRWIQLLATPTNSEAKAVNE